MSPNLKLWRESASLILAAKSTFSAPGKFNYKVLVLERSQTSDFMPNNFVFPGGNSSKSDSDIEWFKFYERCGFPRQSFENLMPQSNIPQLLQHHDPGELPKVLSLRLCAIRETFEECGILLCRSLKTETNKNHVASNWSSFIGGGDVIKWQHKVHDDPREFMNLCSQLEVYPDVWSLRNWSNWATPPSLPSRFNTLFFLATLNQLPVAHGDEREVQSLMWTTPDVCLSQHSRDEIKLAIPQFYELSRLQNFPGIDELAKFAKGRSKAGCELYWPFRVKANEGVYAILPGDDLYPDKIDENDRKPKVFSDLPESSTKNRVLVNKKFVNKLITQNFTPKCEHVAPPSDTFSSKL